MLVILSTHQVIVLTTSISDCKVIKGLKKYIIETLFQNLRSFSPFYSKIPSAIFLAWLWWICGCYNDTLLSATIYKNWLHKSLKTQKRPSPPSRYTEWKTYRFIQMGAILMGREALMWALWVSTDKRIPWEVRGYMMSRWNDYRSLGYFCIS